MPDSGLSGRYGLIPNNVYKEKFEITNIQESPYEVEDYLREQMKDFSPDAPFFESDQIRRDNHSEERISLRINGHRSGEVPDAPDLFLELTERDPRGTSLDPNMRKFQEQSWSRAGYFKFYDDSDNSVTEREKRPWQLTQQIREQFENIKARLKIFSTSKDHLTASGKNFKFTEDSRMQLMEREGFAPNISMLTSAPRADMTVLQSNNMPLGWAQTGDHEFKIARYGQTGRNGVWDQDAALQQHDVEYDTAKLTTFQDQVVTVGVAQIMKQLATEKQRRDTENEQKMNTKILATIVPNKYKAFINNDSARSEKVHLDQEFEESVKMVERFIGQLNAQSGMQGQDIETQLALISAMDAAAMAPGKLGAQKWERKVQEIATQSLSQTENFAQNSGVQRGVIKSDDAKGKRNTLGSQNANKADWAANMKVAPLGKIGDQIKQRSMGTDIDSKTLKNSQGTMKKSTKTPDRINTRATTGQQSLSAVAEGVYTGGKGGLGSKYLRTKTDNERELNAIALAS
jgi:hypothetical protein